MACLDENTIVAFFEASLPEDERAGIDAHLASCDVCRRLLAEYAAMAPPVDATEPALSLDRTRGGEDDIADLGRRVAVAQAARRVGTLLAGKWRIERLLGIGGMAQVFSAKHRNGHRVAVKMMRPELSVEPKLVERFLREGYVANKVDHPGAVAILDDDVTSEGEPFLVLELLEGQTLRECLCDGPLSLAETLRVADEVLDVLAASHDKGIVHRDVKPDNLFRTKSGAVKVLDFGIARLRERMATGGVTQSGMTMGTVGYMPPEQARGQANAVDARSDVWAVGATLFTLLCRRKLHDAPTANEALLLAMTVPVPPMRTLLPALPEAVCTLLDTALAFDREARFADGKAMQRAVRAARDACEVPGDIALRSREEEVASRHGGLHDGAPRTPTAAWDNRSPSGTLLGFTTPTPRKSESQPETPRVFAPPLSRVAAPARPRGRLFTSAAIVVVGIATAIVVAKTVATPASQPPIFQADSTPSPPATVGVDAGGVAPMEAGAAAAPPSSTTPAPMASSVEPRATATSSANRKVVTSRSEPVPAPRIPALVPAPTAPPLDPLARRR